MQANETATVQYDAHTWTVDAGPNAMGYYKLSRNGTDYPHSAYVHGNDLTFQPEASDVMDVVDALYSVYLKREGTSALALATTIKALEVLGWKSERAYRAASRALARY